MSRTDPFQAKKKKEPLDAFAPESFDAIIALQFPHVRDLCEKVRALVHKTAGGHPIVESIKWNLPFFSRRTIFAYIDPDRDHLEVGFCRGAALAAKHPVLMGEGKLIRKVLIHRWTKTLERDLTRVLRDSVQLEDEGESLIARIYPDRARRKGPLPRTTKGSKRGAARRKQ